MRYIILNYVKPQDFEDSAQLKIELEKIDGEKYINELIASSALQSGYALKPAFTATTVRIRSGQRMLRDGPYSATPEQLSDCYVIEAINLDEALDLAAKSPAVLEGAVEVRPISRCNFA
jgi:hypothetical protein